MKFHLFGKEVAIKSHGCHQPDVPGHRIPPSANIFVKVTNRCNAACLFCSNAIGESAVADFNLPKLLEVFREIQQQGIRVNRVNITGGEPSVVPEVVQSILSTCTDNEFKHLHLHLNTNGIFHEAHELMRNPRWDSISMSLHHYDAGKLSQLHATHVSAKAFELEGIDLNKVNVSCNLIKGYIDSAEEVHKILDFTLQMKIPRIGFVSLMKVNDYCTHHYVDFEEIMLETIPHVYFTKSMNRGSDCKCSNYLYNKGHNILEIYVRNYMNPLYCESSLVYDGQHLRQGFHKQNIIH